MSKSNKYCESLTKYKRRESRVVHIGDIPLGGDYPIRVQSMTTTDTMDTHATVEQAIRMIEAECEYVRITAPSIREARNLGEIKKQLRKQGYKTPLIADIHFTPNAALEAARIADKVASLPLGLEHRLLSGGAGLSSGEKQRLCLARALVGQPNIIFLDEMSANLDLATEEIIAQSLAELKGSCTVLFSTHRPTLLSLADQKVSLSLPDTPKQLPC